MKFTNFKSFFIIYLSFLSIVAVYYLFDKHAGGADGTISEWLINYQGAFVKRGLVGEICFQVAKYFDLSLRFVIFLFQSFIYLIFLILIYRFFKDTPKSLIITLSILTPIFLLYPVAEVEVLARKETFVFISLIIFLNISNYNYSDNIPLYYIFFILPIVCLIWEPVIFFFPFLVSVLLIRLRDNKIVPLFSKIIICFIPSLIILFILATNPITPENHLIMENALKDNFGEDCYSSCGRLKTVSSIISQFSVNAGLYSLEVFIRYFLIILIGFGPIFLLCLNTNLKFKVIFFKNFKNLFYPILLLLTPVLILFSMGSDWGRWVNISYTFTALFYFYLLQNKFLEIDLEKIEKKIHFLTKKKSLFILFFVIYAFGWNPKTVITGDVASFPGYKIPYKFIKSVYNKLK